MSPLQPPSILLHRLAITVGETLPAAMALVAKYRGDVLNAQAINKLEAPQDAVARTSETTVDKSA